MSELFFVILLLISIASIFLAYRYLSKDGLYLMLIIMTVTSYILSFKVIHVFGLDFNASIISFISILELIYILKEKEPRKAQNKIIFTIMFTCLATLFVILITNCYIPSINDITSVNMKQTFFDHYLILVTYPFILISTEAITAKFYDTLNEIYKSKFITSTLLYITIGLIYSVIFSLISYIGLVSINDQIYYGLSTYIIGLIITVIYSPLLIYLTNRKRVRL